VFAGAGGSHQVHDYNPGEENGLFWTVPIPTNSVRVDIEDGIAALALSDFGIDDYGTVGNAISGGKEIGTARLSLRVKWQHPAESFSFVNPGLPTPFRANGVKTEATMSWSAHETIGDVTHRLSGDENSADFAMVANERNGVFFPGDEDGDDENDSQGNSG
jgi:hypothetical protein